MTQKRGYLKIAYDILSLAVGGCGITTIVYKGNLNFPIAKKHIEGLAQRELITIEDVGARKLFMTTDRGREFIHRMESTLSIWDQGEVIEGVLT